jgi:hypothetical protein
MKWITGLALAMALGTPALAAGWEMHEDKDPMNDQVTYGAALKGDGGLLVVMCKAGTASIIFSTKTYLGDYDTRPIEYRFDDEPLVKDNWTSSKAITTIDNAEAIVFAIHIERAKRLVIRAYNFQSESFTGIFDLTGAASAIPKVLAHCTTSGS